MNKQDKTRTKNNKTTKAQPKPRLMQPTITEQRFLQRAPDQTQGPIIQKTN